MGVGSQRGEIGEKRRKNRGKRGWKGKGEEQLPSHAEKRKGALLGNSFDVEEKQSLH